MGSSHFFFLGERSSKRVRLAGEDMWKPFRKSTNKKAPRPPFYS